MMVDFQRVAITSRPLVASLRAANVEIERLNGEIERLKEARHGLTRMLELESEIKRLEGELAEAQSRSAIDERQCDEVTSEAGRQAVALEDEISRLRERVWGSDDDAAPKMLGLALMAGAVASGFTVGLWAGWVIWAP